MKNLLKRSLSVILTVLLICTIIPMGTVDVLAATTVSDLDLELGTKDGITRAEWLHDLVVVFNMTVEDESLPDNYFADLTEDHEYYSDILLAVEFGVVDIEAGGELCPDDYVTRDFAVSTLNFCLGYQLEEGTEYSFTDYESCSSPDSAQIAVDRGWLKLSGGCFEPTTLVTSAETEAMFTDAANVLEEAVVDTEYDSTYDFADDVIVVEKGTFVSEDENGVVSITDCPETISVGDKFAVYYEELPCVYVAETVTVANGVTEITTSVVETEEAYTDVDAEGEAGMDIMEIIPADGIDVSLEEETGVSTYASRATKSIKTINVPAKIKLGDGIEANVNVKIKNPKIEYSVNSKYAYVALLGNTEINYGISVDFLTGAGYSKSVKLFTCNVAGIGSFDVSIVLNVAGSATGTVKGYLVAGVESEKGGNIRAIKSFTQSQYYTNVEANAKVGLRTSLGVTKLPVISASVFAEMGANAKLGSTTYHDGSSPRNCTHFSAYMYANYGANASVKFGSWKKSFNKTYDIYTVANSPVRVVHHYEDGREVRSCTRGNNYSNFFTNGYSRWGGSGWISADGAYGLNPDGTYFPLYNYTLDKENNATITKYNANSWSVYIPEKIDGYTVVKIGENSFRNKDMSAIVIPDAVTEIGSGAFLECDNLSSVDLPDSLKKMGAYAFGYCDNLRNITIPKSLEETYSAYYYDYVYGYCYGVFRGCSNLKDVSFEDGTTKVVNGLFTGCIGLEEIIIPDSVTIIGSQAFATCSNLSNIELSDNLVTIGESAFRGTSITEIKIPNKVTAISAGAFADCINLSKVDLSKSLDTMGAYAFACCESLNDIKIPKNLKKTTTAYFNEYLYGYHYGPFFGCDNLKNITFEDGITEIATGLFANNNGIENIEIPNTVTKVKNSAFLSCKNLKNVKLSESLLVIESKAFRDTSIVSIDVPDTVTSIADGAFADCKKLSTVNLSKALSTIGAYAFACCESLTEIEIPKSLKTTTNAYYNEYIYNYHFGPFFGCSNLKKVTFEKGTTIIPQGLFANNNSLETIEIPGTVTKIDYQAFLNCSNLKTVKLNEGLVEIAQDAFNKTALKTIDLPNTLVTIGQGAFVSTDLEKIVIPNSVTTLGKWCFQNCENLETAKLSDKCSYLAPYVFENCISLCEIELPESIIKIQDHAFKGCQSLENVVFTDSLNQIDSYAFENCDGLEKIEIPSSVTTYGEGIFYDCDKLTSVTLGTGMTQLPARTFEHCDAIESIVLPYRTASVGNNAFKECVKLTSITIPRATTSISNSAFSYPSILTITGVKGTYAETYASEIGAKFVDKQVNATNVTIDKNTVTINKGQTVKLVMSVTPLDFTDEVVWKSSNTDVATVADDGTITAKSVGTSTIKLTVGSVSTSCKVTVVQPVTGVYIDKNSVTLEAYDTYQLNCSVYPDNAANKAVKWSSLNSDIASVSGNGFVTAHKKGEAVIRVDALDGSGRYDTCTIFVENNGVFAETVSELESEHNYSVDCKDFWQFTVDGAQAISVTFDSKTELEDGFDYLYIYDGDKNLVGQYTGTELSAKTLTINDDTVRIQLVSDDSGTAWGFKVTDVKIATIHNHSYTSSITKVATCTEEGVKTFVCDCGDCYTQTIPATGHTPSDWITDQKATVNAVGKKHKQCTECGEILETETIKQLKCSKPKLKTIANTATGVKLTWGKVSGADSYEVYRKVKGGSYSKVGTTSKTYFTDKKAKSGKQYYYVVKAVNEAGKSSNSSYKTIKYLADPTLKTPTSAKKGITLKWSKVTGAQGYVVYRKTGNGSFTKITTVKGVSKISCVDKSTKKGKKYTYKVKAYYGKTYSAYSNTKTIKDKY